MATAPEIRVAASEEEIAAAIEVRRAVFVAEQGGPADEEPDARDAEARHYLVREGQRPVGAARLLSAGEETARIGRVCLLPGARGRGWGASLVEFIVAHARSLGAREVILDAQVAAVGFYEGLGFVAEGEVFQDAGIPHRRMRRRLD